VKRSIHLYTTLSSAALLTLLPAARGQVVVPPAKITIGDGTVSSGTFNGTDEEPFLDALDFLEDEGQGFGGRSRCSRVPTRSPPPSP
jgi:hypothetical protein